jgi:uncharacterized membrane protein YphA (DoxX/SURF4 family)
MSSIRTFITEQHTWEWLSILVTRLAVGLFFFLSGRGKLFVPDRREQMRQTLLEARVPFPSSMLSLFRRWSLSAVCFSSSAH